MRVEKEFPASLDELDNVLAFAEEELEKADCPMKKQMTIAVCLEEIFVNIAHYAYGGAEGKMRLAIDCADGTAEFRFTDWGVEFDPLKKADPDITLSAEERGIGGLGIFMVKKSMDDVRYERRDGMNILTLVKAL